MNIGAQGSTAEEAESRVLAMQVKLHRWSGENRSRRFDDLHNLICDHAFLLVAWRRVAGNMGARTAGVDGLTVRRIEQKQGVDEFLAEIRSELKARSYRPSPVRERMIPKANGKFRRLGIPTVRDRVVQAVLKLVLEPIFEAGFQPFSYGFRPRRRTHDAIAEIHHLGSRSYEWVLEADIESCFDQISHSALIGRMCTRIKDKRIIALVKAFLKAGILTELGRDEETLTGTPQGGILSPLLANIALSALDDHFAQEWQEKMSTYVSRRERRGRGLGNWRLIRYADDFVAMISGTREHAEALRGRVQAALTPLGLRLSEAKTRVVHLDDGFDFLGFRIQRRRKRGTNERVVYAYPSKKALEMVKAKVRALTQRSSNTLEEVLPRINAVVRGWCNYFRYGVSKSTFSYLRYYVWHRVARWIWKRHNRMPWTILKRRIMPDWPNIRTGNVTLYQADSTPVTRYRFRGWRILNPWAATAPSNPPIVELVESPVR